MKKNKKKPDNFRVQLLGIPSCLRVLPWFHMVLLIPLHKDWYLTCPYLSAKGKDPGDPRRSHDILVFRVGDPSIVWVILVFRSGCICLLSIENYGICGLRLEGALSTGAMSSPAVCWCNDIAKFGTCNTSIVPRLRRLLSQAQLSGGHLACQIPNEA